MDFQQKRVSFMRFIFAPKSQESKINKYIVLYCCVREKRPHLEPIQEESEVEDECQTSETEGTEEFPSPVGHEDDEEEELVLRRPKRVPCCLSQTFPHVQKETEQLSPSRQSISALQNRSFDFSKISWQKQAPPKPLVREKRTTKRRRRDRGVSYRCS